MHCRLAMPLSAKVKTRRTPVIPTRHCMQPRCNQSGKTAVQVALLMTRDDPP